MQLDIAGRFEHYTDFGDAPIGKITARYDFTENFALRGTAATGFRAPTLGEEYYSATNVAPGYAFVQLPPNSAAAALLGVEPLKPEHSTNYSVGGIAHFGDLTMSLDGYSISVRDRIYSTGSLYGSSGGTVVSTAINKAIAAHGNVLDPTVVCCGFTGVNIFVNGLSTDTKGLDFTGSYRSDFAEYGTVTWSLAANWNQNTVTNFQKTTPELAGQYLFSPTSLKRWSTVLQRRGLRFRPTGLTAGSKCIWRKGSMVRQSISPVPMASRFTAMKFPSRGSPIWSSDI